MKKQLTKHGMFWLLYKLPFQSLKCLRFTELHQNNKIIKKKKTK
jgi:hypothetical protein